MWSYDAKLTLVYVGLIVVILIAVYLFNKDLNKLNDKLVRNINNIKRDIDMNRDSFEYLNVKIESLDNDILDLKTEIKELESKKANSRKKPNLSTYSSRKEIL